MAVSRDSLERIAFQMLVGLVGLLVSVCACSATETFTVRAHPVLNSVLNSCSNGTFQLQKVGGPKAIPSSGLGGGCVVFRAQDLGFNVMAGKICQKNSDCSTIGENTIGYCETESHECWSRPNHPEARTDLCNLGFVLEPLVLNPVPKTPVDLTKFGIQAGAKIRVLACLNQIDAVIPVDGCGSADGAKRIEVFGPVTTLRAEQ